MVYYDPRTPKPWPIRLLNTWGVSNDTAATYIIIAASVVFLTVAVILFFNTTAENTIDRNLNQEQLRSIGL